MNYWFTSDQHFYHSNIIKFCNRPFSCVNDMNATLVDNYNRVVNDNDYVVFLGDFSWSGLGLTIEILKQLKGRIHYVAGNHDRIMNKPEIHYYLESYNNLHEVRIKDASALRKEQYVICMHYAMRTWNKSHRGSWHLYGHSHGTLPEDNSLSIDVGVDAVALRYSKNKILNPKDYRPISYDEIRGIIRKKERMSK